MNTQIRYFHGKLLFRIAIVLFLSLQLTSGLVKAADDVVRVGVYENAQKFFTSASGQPSGIFIDIIDHIAKKEGWEITYVPGTWGEGLDRLKKGEIDLMPDVAYTADRGEIFSFQLATRQIKIRLADWLFDLKRKFHSFQHSYCITP